MTPLDLQMLFSQIDKYAKDLHAQKEGAQLHKTMEMAVQRQTDTEKAKSVHEADTGGKGLNKLNSGGSGGTGENSGKKKEPGENEEHKEKVRDPNLGRYIDLSG
ncbi:MAG: hypothetical protein LBD22_04915 [Spirochaetaceae bacterium]|nr:hypothetical protein [Spirochaetaceae bacterium]